MRFTKKLAYIYFIWLQHKQNKTHKAHTNSRKRQYDDEYAFSIVHG